MKWDQILILNSKTRWECHYWDIYSTVKINLCSPPFVCKYALSKNKSFLTIKHVSIYIIAGVLFFVKIKTGIFVGKSGFEWEKEIEVIAHLLIRNRNTWRTWSKVTYLLWETEEGERSVYLGIWIVWSYHQPLFWNLKGERVIETT